MTALHQITRPAPTLSLMLFRPLSVPACAQVIDLDTGEWSHCITLDADQYSHIPPAHVVAQIGGGK